MPSPSVPHPARAETCPPPLVEAHATSPVDGKAAASTPFSSSDPADSPNPHKSTPEKSTVETSSPPVLEALSPKWPQVFVLRLPELARPLAEQTFTGENTASPETPAPESPAPKALNPEAPDPEAPRENEAPAAAKKSDQDSAERVWGCCEPPICLCGETESAFVVGWELVRRGLLPPWGSVLALSQTAGKGQLGRHWHSPAGNIYAALRLPACAPFNESAAAPALGGLLAQALNELGLSVSMKWPNDMVAFLPRQDGGEGTWRKLGGILLEERGGVVLAGIGINLHSAPSDDLLRADHALPAGTLADLASWLWPPLEEDANDPEIEEAHPAPRFPSSLASLPPLPLWRELTRRMRVHSTLFPKKWRELAERHLLFRGRAVLLAEDDAASLPPVRGILQGLDEAGGLRLSLPPEQVFYSGSLLFPERKPQKTETCAPHEIGVSCPPYANPPKNLDRHSST